MYKIAMTYKGKRRKLRALDILESKLVLKKLLIISDADSNKNA